MMADRADRGSLAESRSVVTWSKIAFVRLGVLPFLLIIAIIVFSLMSDRFLSTNNLMNVARQSIYLTIVAMGQMLALLTGVMWLNANRIVRSSTYKVPLERSDSEPTSSFTR